MNEVEQILADWGGSLVTSIPVGGLIARNPVAHKWKAPFRALMVRELTLWRMHDLMGQSYLLHQQGAALGARILLRSAVETFAMLTYANLLIERVLSEQLGFHDFCDKTTRLLLGTRGKGEMPEAINILTVLEKSNKRYPGLMDLYADLSESAHPNYDGLMDGYSTVNRDENETTFSNLWVAQHASRHIDYMLMTMRVFQHEYNDVWRTHFEALEAWIVANDEKLEATKDDPSAR